MAKLEQNISKNIFESGFLLHIIIPSKIMFSFFVLKWGGRFKIAPTIGYILILELLYNATPSIPISKQKFPSSISLNYSLIYLLNTLYSFIKCFITFPSHISLDLVVINLQWKDNIYLLFSFHLLKSGCDGSLLAVA